MGELLMGIDVGTSSCKCIVITPCGELLAEASNPYPTYNPQEYYAEQSAEDWWEAVKKSINEIVKKLGEKKQEIRAVGVTSHLEAWVPIDHEGVVLYNGMTWLDRRTLEHANLIKKRIDEKEVIKITGVPVNHVNPAVKIAWFAENHPDLFGQTKKFLSPKDYIVWKLTGELITDFSIASKSMLFNIHNLNWASEVCKELSIPEKMLPEVRGAWEPAGFITPEAASITGLTTDCVVAVGGGDDHCQALSAGAVNKGDINIGTGTGSAWKGIIEAPLPDLQGRVECHSHVVPDRWLYWTGINATGYSVDWFISNFKDGLQEKAVITKEDSYFERFTALAQKAPLGSDGLMYFPHFWGTRIPKFNPMITGGFVGLKDNHSLSHFCRAIMEGVAIKYLGVLEIFKAVGYKPQKVTMIGGEVKNEFWNQMKTDVVGLEIEIPSLFVGSAVGAAILAGCACEYYRNPIEGAESFKNKSRKLQPRKKEHLLYKNVYAQYLRAYQALENL